jgi:lysophospholipase L1-like esterase
LFDNIVLLFLTTLLLLTPVAAQQPNDACQTLKQQLVELETRLRDWPDLARYKSSNPRLGEPAKGEHRIVFLGDSITENWNLDEWFPGKPYVNRGISGQTTPQILLRFRQDVIALKPGIVVILAGTNDIAENTGPTTLEAIEDNLTSMVELAQKNEIGVVLCTVLPVARYPWRPEIQAIEKIQELNRWMKSYAARAGVRLLDFYSAMADQKLGLSEDLGTDGVHPNHAGYAVMTRLAGKMLTPQPGEN